jgi:hypothetical protein
VSALIYNVRPVLDWRRKAGNAPDTYTLVIYIHTRGQNSYKKKNQNIFFFFGLRKSKLNTTD